MIVRYSCLSVFNVPPQLIFRAFSFHEAFISFCGVIMIFDLLALCVISLTSPVFRRDPAEWLQSTA
jgi:hypothetical protein